MNTQINICGQPFDRDLEHFSFKWPFREIKNMSELDKLQEFPALKSANFDSTNLNDVGLKSICSCKTLENISIQNTKVSNHGIRFLARLPELKYLRMKENDQLTNGCIAEINKLSNLIDLQIHETGIDQNGLKDLRLESIENIIVNSSGNSQDFDFLQKLSARLACTILVKGRTEFEHGKVLWVK